MNSTEGSTQKTENALRIEKHRGQLKQQGKAQLNITLPIELHDYVRQFAKDIKAGASFQDAAKNMHQAAEKLIGCVADTASDPVINIKNNSKDRGLPKIKYSMEVSSNKKQIESKGIVFKITRHFIPKRNLTILTKLKLWVGLQARVPVVVFPAFGFHSVPVVTAEQRLAV